MTRYNYTNYTLPYFIWKQKLFRGINCEFYPSKSVNVMGVCLCDLNSSPWWPRARSQSVNKVVLKIWNIYKWENSGSTGFSPCAPKLGKYEMLIFESFKLYFKLNCTGGGDAPPPPPPPPPILPLEYGRPKMAEYVNSK